MTVKLLHRHFQISGRLVLDKSSAVTLTADFGVDNIQARLAGKIFEILKTQG